MTKNQTALLLDNGLTCRDSYLKVAESVFREQELLGILAEFSQNAVSVLLLKGAAFSYCFYDDPSLRQMGDIDLLVKKEQLDLAEQAITALGYVHEPEPFQRVNPFNTEFTGEVTYRKIIGEFVSLVELHWELHPIELFRKTTRLDIDSYWQRAIVIRIKEMNVKVLCPEDALAHTCLHLSLHGFTHLQGYVDIAQILKTQQIDWAVFVKRATQDHVSAACYFPLRIAQKHGKLEIPECALADLRPDFFREKFGLWMADQAIQGVYDKAYTWRHVAWLVIVDKLHDIIKLLLWLFFPGPGWLYERYHLHSRIVAWIWMFVHPFIVTFEGARSLFSVVVALR